MWKRSSSLIRMRAYAQSHQFGAGILSALSDRQISSALEAIHRDPSFHWTVEDLARAAGISRTLFAERMKEILGLSPIEYLTQWRMEVAREALADRHLSVAEVAEKVGYESMPAFSCRMRSEVASRAVFIPGTRRSLRASSTPAYMSGSGPRADRKTSLALPRRKPTARGFRPPVSPPL